MGRHRQPQGAFRFKAPVKFDFVWVASRPRAPLAGPGISASSASQKATPGGIAISDGYSVVDTTNIPSLYATSWTEVGVVLLDGTNAVTVLSARDDGQPVRFVPGSNLVSLVCWGVADIDITGALPVGIVRYVVRRSGNTHTVWLNGKLFGSTSSAATPGASTGIKPGIGTQAGSGGNQGGGPLVATTGVLMVARTGSVFGDARCLQLSANPWQLFSATLGLESFTAPGIAFDATANSGYQAAASTYAFTRTVTGADTFLAIDVSLLSAGQTVTSIVDDFGGTNVNAVFVGAQSTVSSVGRVECWRVVAPVAGTKTIQVNLSGSIASAATAVSYTGVNQTSPTEGFNSAQATNVGAADATVSITTVADNCWVHGAIATDDTAITANQTSRNNVTGVGGSGADEDNNGPKTPAGAVTMSYTNVGALATWAIAGYAIRPVAAGSGTTVTCTVADEAEACPSVSISLSTVVGTSIYTETEACPSASISLSTNIATTVAPEVEAGLTSAIALSTNVAVTTSDETEAGLPLTVNSATNVVCSVANENESGIIVAVGVSTQVNCVIGNEVEAGLAVTISNGVTVVCGVADEQEVGLGVTITTSGGSSTGTTPWYQLALRRGKR